MSLTGENYRGFHVDMGVDLDTLTPEDAHVSDVYKGAVVHGSIQSVQVDIAGAGYLGGGSWKAQDRSAWGSFTCDSKGSIMSATVQNGGQFYSSNMTLLAGFRYPSDCGGRTRDTGSCADKVQDGSFTAVQIANGGLNYVPGELRAFAGEGAGLLVELSVDSKGAIADYVFPDANAHGTDYGTAAPEIKVYYPGTSTQMTGSVTTVQVLSGGEGYTDAELVVECSGACTGSGLHGTCVADKVGGISTVVISNHGTGYTTANPPKLSCGKGQTPAILLARVASGAEFFLTRAGGAALSADGQNHVSSRFTSGRVIKLKRGSGKTTGCTPQDKLVGVGGGGRGFMARILNVRKEGEIRDIVISQAGTGYTHIPELLSTSPSCKCIPLHSDSSTAQDGTVPGSFSDCFSVEVSHYTPFAEGWQIQVHVVDSDKEIVAQYVGGLQPTNRVAVAELGSAAGMMMGRGSIGAKRTNENGHDETSQFFKGEIAEILMYACGESNSNLLGCVAPTDLDRLAMYLSKKFDVPWNPTYGLVREEAVAMGVVQGEGGSGSVPLIKSVRPNFSIGYQAQMITVIGKNMGVVGEDDSVQVEVGMRPCQKPKIIARHDDGSSQIQCLAPPGYSREVDVSVSLYGISATLDKAFRHGAAEAGRVEPASVPSIAGSTLTLHGSNFLSSPAFSVSVESHNTTICQNLVIESDSVLKCTLPTLYTEVATIKLTVNEQEENSAISSTAQFHVFGVPTFVGECRPESGLPTCLSCCMSSCSQWLTGLRNYPSFNDHDSDLAVNCEQECLGTCAVAGKAGNHTEIGPSGSLMHGLSV